MSGSRTVDKIQGEIDQQTKLMFVHEKNGNYDDAQKCRLKIEQLKKDHEARSVYEMQQRHKRQMNDLIKSNNSEMASFNDLFNKRTDQINQEAEKSQSQLNGKHKQDQNNTRAELQEQFSLKVKQSSQLLNLRKMEQHMVKQQNFAQAHKVQQQIFQRQSNQKKAWLQKRNQRIETALATLRGKQNVEMTNLKKRYRTLIDELNTDRKIQQNRLSKKHDNLINDLSSQHQKQILNYKGQFRSKGGKDSPMRTRTSFAN